MCTLQIKDDKRTDASSEARLAGKHWMEVLTFIQAAFRCAKTARACHFFFSCPSVTETWSPAKAFPA